MTTAMLPKVLDHRTLVEMAGTNIPPVRVKFEGDTYDGTLEHVDDPEAAIAGMTAAVYEEFEMVTRSMELLDYTVAEMAVALGEALERLPYGKSMMIHVNQKTTSTREIVVGIGPDGRKLTRIIHDGDNYTAMSLPGFSKLGVNQPAWIMVSQYGNGCVVTAKLRRRNQGSVTGLFKFLREWCDNHSIYINQCINDAHEFQDLSKFNRDSVARTDVIQDALNKYVVGPLTQMDRIISDGLSPKTGLLFEGPAGTGKTMTVTWGESTCLKAGGTVIRIRAGSGIAGFERAFAIAKRLMAADHLVMLTMEDIEVLSKADRSRVLDLLDGGGAKSDKRIILATTNNQEVLEKAFKRPGRWNAVLHCALPDVAAYRHLVTLQFGDRLGDIDWGRAFEAYEGYTYAFIANASDSIKRGLLLVGSDAKITTEQLIAAGHEQRGYYNLLEQEYEQPLPDLESTFRSLMYNEVASYLGDNMVSAYDATDYDAVRSMVDDVIESRVHNANIELRTEDGRDISGNLTTN